MKWGAIVKKLITKKSRGLGLIEALLGSALLAMGMVGLMTFTTKSVQSKRIVEAKADVEGIAEVMQTSLSQMPSTEAEYRQVLGSKWTKTVDPWGNYYRMIVANNLSSNLCGLSETSLNVELPDGQVVRNVLYLVWTRPQSMAGSASGMPSPGARESLSRFNGIVYARYNGTVVLTRDAIYDLYTLDMYKAKYCSTSGGSVSPFGESGQLPVFYVKCGCSNYFDTWTELYCGSTLCEYYVLRSNPYAFVSINMHWRHYPSQYNLKLVAIKDRWYGWYIFDPAYAGAVGRVGPLLQDGYPSSDLPVGEFVVIGQPEHAIYHNSAWWEWGLWLYYTIRHYYQYWWYYGLW